MAEPTRTFYTLRPEELRTLADEIERRDGNYVELLGQDYGPAIVTHVKLDDEAGGEAFSVNEEGHVQ
jgi:ribosomal protein S16